MKIQCRCKIIENNRLVEVCPMHYSMMMENSSIKWACVTDWPTAHMYGIPVVMQSVYEKHKQQ